MITAAAPAFLNLRLSVTSVTGQARRTACATTAVTCGYAAKVTIYNCRIRVQAGQSGDSHRLV
jgi:hypothetical protein